MTTARESAQAEQDERTRRYLITMGIRTVSFVLAAMTHGWVRWTFVVLAAFLPYLAVVAANAVRPRALGPALTAPGGTKHLGADPSAERPHEEGSAPPSLPPA